ncbi:hypothetical protein FPV67DRAFT_1725303 [Lyophyllum atratum]|nr:hypothetical protein FPV67DRAFT_1725303 [Lyophyllum atratum]
MKSSNNLKRRLAELGELEARSETRTMKKQQTRYAERTIINGTNITTTTTPLPLDLPPIIEYLPTVPLPELPTLSSPQEPPKKKTQASEDLQGFQNEMPRLLQLLLAQEADISIGSTCPCHRGPRTTQCRDCLLYHASCTDCFIDAHRTQPTHWAYVWDSEKGFFIRRDISTLRENGYAIHFGHHGDPCPNPATDTDILFHIIDTNGIHNTKVRFCLCFGAPGRWEQLMSMRLFPATLRRPTTAFTFNVLKQFHLHHLESKESAYDFIGALRRLTDNAFAHQVSDPYPQFRLVMRVWRILTATKRLGQAHMIDEILIHRQPGNLIVFCPACPEPHVNLEPGWKETPSELVHINIKKLTADGNHHANHFAKPKTSDPDDVSLYAGRAYFPDDVEYREHMRKLPVTSEKSDCNYLNAMNKQDRKKFKNMDVTGIVNIQCPHVFVEASVDMQYGEKFGNTDYALAHALRQIKDLENIDGHLINVIQRFFCYDISCGYDVNIIPRFQRSHPDLVPIVERMCYLIPLVHVHNHKDNCMYCYSSAYTAHAGHFHGETAEHYWPECNQLGGQTRQMNNGHRQDTLIDHHSDWNWKKVANMATSLEEDVSYAKRLFLHKRAHFQGLSLLYAAQVPVWDKLDRKSRIKGADKEVQCVYRHNQHKVPSQSAIYQFMLSTEANRKEAADLNAAGLGKITVFLNEGLNLARIQLELRALVKQNKEHTLESTRTDISTGREKLSSRISKWRSLQKSVMAPIGDRVLAQSVSKAFADTPECEILFLPSDFTAEERVTFNLTELAQSEYQLREGAAFDALRSVRNIVKTLGTIGHEKKTQDYGQMRNTRSNNQILATKARLDAAISHYNKTRVAMILLGLDEKDLMFPPLELKDTFRQSTLAKRQVGDSRRSDGPIWTMTGVTGGARRASFEVGSSIISQPESGPSTGTQGSKAKRKASKKTAGNKKGTQRQPPQDTIASKSTNTTTQASLLQDGWIWRLQSMGKMSETELQKWAEEGDRVQWFRAEAEMQRWQEEWEVKQAEFMRCIRTFKMMSDVWSKLASTISASSPGHVAYAKKKSAMYREMELFARKKFISVGYGDRLSADSGTLVDHVLRDREKFDTSPFPAHRPDEQDDDEEELDRPGQARSSLMSR